MKFRFTRVALLLIICAPLTNAIVLDREAFTFTNYDLTVQVEPEQHRIAVRGKITLRNDSQSPQKIAVLQISSSLDWRSVKAGEKPLQFVSQPYASDMDHTGGLSEAIVTLPQPIAPSSSIELEIAYEGVILPDATRWTRINMPENTALSTDWDQISSNFTGLRGAGYVAWYPIATDVANLSEGNSLAEVLDRWKARQSGSTMRLRGSLSTSGSEAPQFLFSGAQCTEGAFEAMAAALHLEVDCPSQPFRLETPTLVIADYKVVERPAIEVRYLPGHDAAATYFADEAQRIAPFIGDWFGKPRERAKTAELPDRGGAPFESGALLLTPLPTVNSTLAGLAAAHQLTHAAYLSFRPWIEEGLAHFAQALYLEQRGTRQAALDYMGAHRSAFSEDPDATALPRSEDAVKRALVNTINDALYRSKAMFVWWMLRDMVGEAALKKALANYRPEQDKEPAYMPRLIAAQTQRELDWFFDDWLYHDRGLPDFKVESAFSRKTGTGSFMVTVSILNLGTAGAEVPVTVKYAGGELSRRLEVRAKTKAAIRVEVPSAPVEVVVNDGSVPELKTGNNAFAIQPQEP
jgi:hypothetical protein